MEVDEVRFLTEFTLRMCGTLDIHKALWHTLLYVRAVSQADELILTSYDPDTGGLEVLATAEHHKGTVRSYKTALPPQIKEWFLEPSRPLRVKLLDNPREGGLFAVLADKFKWPTSSFIVNSLTIDNKLAGLLIIRATGRGRFSSDDLALWSLVNEPVSVALANNLRYRELLSLKERLIDDVRYFQEELHRQFNEEIVGAESGLKEVMEQVYRVAPLSATVLLHGETGTGKELVANAIHRFSPWHAGPLIKVNCGAIPDTLIDSELFGHEKGAFTGALSQYRGKFERAHGGTIFLDEVTEIPIHAQARLLRVIQEKEIERVGGGHPLKLDVRIISATNKNIEQLVAQGLFREDLYYRLSVFPIRVPPLRERKEDLPGLVDYFVRTKSREIGLFSRPTLLPGTLENLAKYNWPGNVRELGNAIERAIILNRGTPISSEDILDFRRGETPHVEHNGRSNDLAFRTMEIQQYRKALDLADGKIEGPKGAAALLDMNPATLRSRMRKLGIPFGSRGKGPGRTPADKQEPAKDRQK
jgi:transcriptional regulator with GAF, ATPase, and Fis domain